MIIRKLLIALLAVGAVSGFAHGFAHLGACHHGRRAAFEDHVADVCLRAAQRLDGERAAEGADPADRGSGTEAASP